MVVRYDGRATSVRLLELDTPESVYPAASVQHFGPESAAFTTARLDSQTVQLVKDRTGNTQNASGRLLRHVCLEFQRPPPPGQAGFPVEGAVLMGVRVLSVADFSVRAARM